MQNAISWFEIPATDLDRATKFYETIFAVHLRHWIWTILKCACFR